MRFLIFFLICLLFAGPHVFRVKAPPVLVPVSQAVATENPGFFDRSEGRINRWMQRNLPDFVYAWAPTVFAPAMGLLKEIYIWGRTVPMDPEAGFAQRSGAKTVMWIFYHPWITSFLAVFLMWRGRRWIVWPLRRVLLGRR